MEHPIHSHEVALAAALVGGGLVVAAVLRVALGWVARRAGHGAVGSVGAVATLLRGLLPPSLVVLGLWLGEVQLPLQPHVRQTVDRILLGALLLIVTLVLAGLGVRATRAFAQRRSGVAPSTSIFANVVRVAVLVVGILVVLETIGVSIAPLLTALGVGGIAVALALQDTLSNLFAGIHLLASKKIEPGDYIMLSSGEEGYVVDVNWRNTSIRALADNMVLVPNAQLSSAVVTNFHQPVQPMSVVVQVGVSYDSDLEHVERVTIEVAREVMREVDGGVIDYEPGVRFHTFAESSINFSVLLRAKEYTNQYILKHEFVKRLHRRYRAEGIEIPFPIRTIITQAADD